MRRHAHVIVWLVTVLGAAAALPQVLAADGVQSVTAGRLFADGQTSDKPSPYSTLFEPRVTPAPRFLQATPQKRPGTAGRPAVVCGMTIVPADPSIDPGIFARGSGIATRHTIRAVEPPICHVDPAR